MPPDPGPTSNAGLPRISTRVFQLLDHGAQPWAAVLIAVGEYVAALRVYLGNLASQDIGEIGK